MPQPATENASAAPTRFSPVARFLVPALWVAAGVLLGLFFFDGQATDAQLQIKGLTSKAHAGGMISHSGTFAALTNETNNEDLLIVLDQRTESLLVYRTDAQRGIDLQQRVALPRIFEDARVRAVGRP